MNILLLMIPLSLLLLAAAVWAFVWAVRRGQFEDLDTPAIDILREDPHERAQRLQRDAAATPVDGDAADSAPPADAGGRDAPTAGRD
ncbi:cbb3-type cytochrome oxidase assembly protein CcoS [Novilysobacter arseniciresistens]|uniref:cbb3-type cytochrome oxidase assembly protein CcoS n=1 Tax=Novilysobacter arseniciresistens TaxID=1385522 RepID=UPI0009DF58DB